jgi:Ring finger domain
MDPGGCLYAQEEEEEEVWETDSDFSFADKDDELNFIYQLSAEIRTDQAAALESGAQRLLEMDFGDDESEAYEEQEEEQEEELQELAEEKPKVDVSKPLVEPLFALPCGFAFPECAICYEPIEMVNVTVTTCGHVFHASCAFKALDRADCCPMCRHQLVDELPEEEDEDSEGGEDEDEDEEGSQDGEEEEEEEVAKVSLEQLTGKLTNMGYTMGDIIRSLVHVKSETNEAKYTEERDDKLHADIWGIMDGTISLAHRDARSYAQVVAVPAVQLKELERRLLANRPQPQVAV